MHTDVKSPTDDGLMVFTWQNHKVVAESLLNMYSYGSSA